MSTININGIKYKQILFKGSRYTIMPVDKLHAFIYTRMSKKEQQLVNRIQQLDNSNGDKESLQDVYKHYYIWIGKMFKLYGKIHF